MNYKETLFFIGKCLTINHEAHNKVLVEQELKSKNIDWESIVKVSTAHYVFPAIYCNLKKANFLHYLPNDLVEYMKHITDLNRERNQQIITQAKEINELLLANNINPIFLKGTGNLLEGLYDDIAERMVGDIDFLVSKEEYQKTIKTLKTFGYSKIHTDNYDPLSFKHYPELVKEGRIAAVEIHKNVLTEEYINEFNYDLITKDYLIINGICFLSFKNQLNLSIIANQINDDGQYFKNIALRNAYDVFLLSKKTKVKEAFNNLDRLKKPLENFIIVSDTIFNSLDSLSYEKSKETANFIRSFLNYLENSSLGKKEYQKTKNKIFIQKRLSIVYKSIFNKEHRNWVIKRVTDRKWQKEKLIQLGLKKPKPDA